MFLRCSVCQAVQPVTTPDVIDEDARTRAIREAFRATHAESCGEGSVRLILYDPLEGYEPPDPDCWQHYLDSLTDRPSFVQEDPDGLFSMIVYGKRVRVCEDCWQPIPPYRDFPQGLTSPESDGANGRVPKRKITQTETLDPSRRLAAQAIRKAVCFECYVEAFRRTYPMAGLPPLLPVLQPTQVAAEPDHESGWVRQ